PSQIELLYVRLTSIIFPTFALKSRINSMTDFRLGITLSGGGARGIAHIGVLKALEDYGIRPEAISGTSMGAIVGSLYADGKTPEEILDIIHRYKLSSFFRWNLPRSGLMDTRKLYDIINNSLEAKTFEDLQMELHVSTSNLNSGDYDIFNSGDLVSPVVASSCIPMLFKPMEIHGDMHADGGLLNNLPVEPLRKTCSHIIGVHVNRNGRIDKVKGMRSVADRSFRIAIWQTVKARLPECDFVIEPTGVYDYSTFAFDKAEELYQHGYQHTEAQILNLLGKFNLKRVIERQSQK
ncbi:MAG: patatin-like phospholipase family protein, partial [Bacteroidota bacterium]